MADLVVHCFWVASGYIMKVVVLVVSCHRGVDLVLALQDLFILSLNPILSDQAFCKFCR